MLAERYLVYFIHAITTTIQILEQYLLPHPYRSRDFTGTLLVQYHSRIYVRRIIFISFLQ